MRLKYVSKEGDYLHSTIASAISVDMATTVTRDVNVARKIEMLCGRTVF